jgi:DNA-binding NarL/FixJ family response regulator
MDIAMPGLNGIEATSQVRYHCPQTQVVILSMHGTVEYIYRALRAGALAYVLKESAGSEVVQAVRSAHAGRRFLSREVADVVIDDYIQDRQRPSQESPLERLSDREREVLQLVVEGETSKEIARLLHLSPKTVDTYRSRIMLKLDLSNLPSLVKFAIEHGVTPPT